MGYRALINFEIGGIDTTHICLIELCTPNLNVPPDNFIKINAVNDVEPRKVSFPENTSIFLVTHMQITDLPMKELNLGALMKLQYTGNYI